MFLASLHFPYKICTPLNDCLLTLREAIHWVGQLVMERKHGVNVEFLGLRDAGGLRDSMSPSRLSSCTMSSLWQLPLRVCCRLEPKEGLCCSHPVQWNISLMGICFCPWLSHDPSTNRFGLSCLNLGLQLSDPWTDQEDVSPFHNNDRAKLGDNLLLFALGSLTTETILQCWTWSGPVEL